MKRFVFAFIITVLLCYPALAASDTELAKMGTFISNFTEARMYNIDADSISQEELVHFGTWHNAVNNYNSRIRVRPNGKHGSLLISKKFVAESVKKYFNIDLKHASTEEAYYDGKDYHFSHADGDPVYYADVQEVSRKGNIITMRGELYSSEDEDYKAATFTARAKPFKYGGKNTWYLLSLDTQWREEE